MKPLTLLAVLMVGGIGAAIWLSQRAPATASGVKEEMTGLDAGDAGTIKLLEGQVEYLEGQVKVLQEENSALLDQLGRLGMKGGGQGVDATEVAPDFVGLGIELVKLRELKALPTAALPVPAAVIEEKVLKWLRARQPGDRGELLGRALYAIGAIPEALDPLPLRAALMVKQLGAWYDADDATLYVDETSAGDARGAHREALGLALAQLLREHGESLFGTHASGPLTFDQQLAREAVLAGDAGMTRFLFSLQRPEIQDRNELPTEDPDHPFNQVVMPQFLREMHFFPYNDGFEFMQGLHSVGGFGQMNGAYNRPPRNTAEVLDGERYLTGAGVAAGSLDFKPVEIAGAPPFWDDVMGKYAILAMLKAWNEPERAGMGAQGWVADRLLIYRGADERQRGHAVWQTLWQDGEWAEAFFRAMAECLKQRYAVPLSGKEEGMLSFEAGGRNVTMTINREGTGVVLVDAGDGEVAKLLLMGYRNP